MNPIQRYNGLRHLLVLGVFLWGLDGCPVAGASQSSRDYYQVTTTAVYKPVSVPGTQRRVAQNEAEDKARRLIYEHVGSLPVSGRRTVNDVLLRDARLKAKMLELVRTAELVDWNVIPQSSSVTVCMRLDLNKVRNLLCLCGYR